MPDAQPPEIGRARLRTEDARLITGKANWTDNIPLPGLLHVAFVRSPMAHARITRVDTGQAEACPGVVAAFSGADLAGDQGGLLCGWPVTADELRGFQGTAEMAAGHFEHAEAELGTIIIDT